MVAKVCCVNNPCKNEAECVPEVRSGKKTFSCKCLPGFTGRLCDVKVRARGCKDYLRANESAVSGLYEIWLNVPTLSKIVYCYFDHVNMEVWTLVMSYSYSHQNDMDPLPFYKDNPINEDSPGFRYYRASLGLMEYLKNESSFWRATCNHDTKPHDDDFMQSYFTALDVMTLESKCFVFLDFASRLVNSSAIANYRSLYVPLQKNLLFELHYIQSVQNRTFIQTGTRNTCMQQPLAIN